ncbi:MAG: hypothetical protein JNL38_31665 [Myxococcales bacterium]|jgi:hypothetical protein|nr:hypothetical protein [Myxococcales bacterium]
MRSDVVGSGWWGVGLATTVAAVAACGAFSADPPSPPKGEADAGPTPDAGASGSSSSSSGGVDGACTNCPRLVAKVAGETIRGLTVAPEGIVVALGKPDTVMVLPPGGAPTPTDLRGFDSPFGQVHSVRSDGAKLFFGTTTGDFAGNLGVYSAPSLGSEAQRFTIASFPCRSFAVVQPNVFCHDGTSSAIARLGPVEIEQWATSPGVVRHLTTDGTTLFWTATEGLYSRGVMDGAAAGIRVVQADYHGVDHADGALYLLEGSGAVVKRVLATGASAIVTGPYASSEPPGPLAVSGGKRVVWARGAEIWSLDLR